jgi:hypothetical protein
MAVIYLTRGYTTIVDDDLWFELNRYRWYASGPEGRPARRLRLGPRKLIYICHQVLGVLPWVLKMNGYEVDYINGDPLDNRLDNLRIITHKKNMRNTLRYGLGGVGYDAYHDRWKAYLDQPDLPRINIGTFLTKEAAWEAVIKMKKELHLENNQD